jgi:hypothetical protein
VRGPSVRAERVDRFQRIAPWSLAAAVDSVGRLVQSKTAAHTVWYFTLVSKTIFVMRSCRVTLRYVTPTDYAAAELEMWEKALREQLDAEKALDAVRRRKRLRRVFELMPQVQALRTRADLLLAEAVKVKLSFIDQKVMAAWDTTQPGAIKNGMPA